MVNEFAERVVDTATISHEEWIESRRKGIGGSDLAIILGVSKWGSLTNIWKDKMRLTKSIREPDNWFTLDYGNAMEPLIRKAFSEITGLTVSKDTWQYRHPFYNHMLRDIDFLCYDEAGNEYIGEIKTTDPNNLDNWESGILGQGGRLPLNYELQVRHYMRVTDIGRAYVICNYGNSIEKNIIVRVDRNTEIESAIIDAENKFWFDYIEKGVCPLEKFISDTAIKQLRENYTAEDKKVINDEKPKSEVKVYEDKSLIEAANLWLEKQAEKKNLEEQVKVINSELNALSVPLTDILGEIDKGIVFDTEDEGIEINFQRQYRATVNKDRLKLEFPEAYKACIDYSESRPFSVKRKSVKTLKKSLSAV